MGINKNVVYEKSPPKVLRVSNVAPDDA